MKAIIIRAGVAVLASVLVPNVSEAQALHNDHADQQVDICHHNQGKPGWVLIEIDESAVQAHLHHQWGKDIYPVPADGCPNPCESFTYEKGDDDECEPTTTTTTPATSSTTS